MCNVVGVRFRPAGKVYYFDPSELELPLRSGVIVETARGAEYGEVAVAVREVPETDVVQPLKRVLRPATAADAQRLADLRDRDREAIQVGKRKIGEHRLDMHLVDVESTFDGSKMIFQFTAEARVDFRELVKDLAGVFRTRIELRQIGVRDEAKILGGVGICGLTLCCSTWLTEFYPVSIRMAKDQNLSLNPAKISGVCGRLLCCLRYELNMSPEPSAASKVAERVERDEEPAEELGAQEPDVQPVPRLDPVPGDRRWAKAVTMPESRPRSRGPVAGSPQSPPQAPISRAPAKPEAPDLAAGPGEPAQGASGSRRRRRRRSRQRRSHPSGGAGGTGRLDGASSSGPGPSNPPPPDGDNR